MKKVRGIIILCATIALLLVFSSSVAAAAFSITGRVTDESGVPIPGSLIEVISTANDTLITSTTTTADGSYTVSVDGGTYNVRVTPPQGSRFGPAMYLGQNVDKNKLLDFVLVPAGQTIFSGRLLDPLGNPILGQRITLTPAGGGTEIYQLTNNQGAFSFAVSAGSYAVQVRYTNNQTNAPAYYFFYSNSTSPLVLTSNINMDITLPVKRVQIHVQDPAGNPVANVRLNTNDVSNNNLSLGILPAYGYTGYPSAWGNYYTDAAGDLTLWLVATSSTYSYTFTATPPTGTPFAIFSTRDITFISDKTIVIVLEFVHSAPVTSIFLSPNPDANGNYPGAVTATLSATAALGYQVTHTYYKIDGGTEVEYTGPFTVLGDGAHSIRYWSIDDLGVYETPKYKYFNIASLKITSDETLPGGSVGGTYSITLQAQGGTPPYTWSVVGGTLPPGLTLGSDTGVISGTPTTAGTFSFTVQVEDTTQIVVTKHLTLAPPPTTGTAGSTYQQPILVPNVPPDAPPGSPLPTCENYRLVSGVLPDGLTMDPVTGIISGLPLDGGEYDFTVECVVITHEVVTKTFTITINNPQPNITRLEPVSVRAKSGDFTLHVIGTNFVKSSVVQWNGNPLMTTFVSVTELEVPITNDLIQTPGNVDVKVVNPLPEGGSSNTVQFTILPPNFPPTVDANGDYMVGEGGSVEVEATGSDPDNDTLTYAWDLDNNGVFETTGKKVNFSAVDIDGPATRMIIVKATDPSGLFATDQATVKIENDGPTATFEAGVVSIVESGSISFTFANQTEPSKADREAGFSYTHNCGNGEPAPTQADPSPSFSCTYPDNGSFSVTGTILDKDGGKNEYTVTVTVDNAAPVVHAISCPIAPVQLGTEINVNATFSDVGVLDTHMALWSWGNNTTSPGTINETNGSGSVTGKYTYTSTGVYTVGLTVKDKDGGEGTGACQAYLVVYDPSGGFVTGGGWFDSPVGAYTVDPGLTGKANFGFVAKYKKGATVPDGETEFQFQVANLNFHSGAYQWLVVAGAKAQFKGTGTINGEGSYKFMITAIDGHVSGGGGTDKFRIRIWTEDAGGNEYTVYDNQLGASVDATPNTTIGGGSIVIHK